jgi:hypothetical protein
MAVRKRLPVHAQETGHFPLEAYLGDLDVVGPIERGCTETRDKKNCDQR